MLLCTNLYNSYGSSEFDFIELFRGRDGVISDSEDSKGLSSRSILETELGCRDSSSLLSRIGDFIKGELLLFALVSEHLQLGV